MKRRRFLAQMASWPFPWHPLNALSFREGNDSAIYYDAQAYFSAFIAAAEQAVSHIYILGWDIHMATQLAPARDPQLTLDSFLRSQLSAKPELQIYLLGWDYSPVFFLEREKWQSLRFSLGHHPRLHFLLDAHHPMGGSHHQKLVVVDDQVAFVGGLDITIRRWDTGSHDAQDPLRKDPDGEPYAPFHDIQMGVTGSAVSDISKIFRERWLRATSTRLRQAGREATRPITLPREGADAFFPDCPLIVSRTSPRFRDYRQVKEIARLYADLIRLAQHHIYIENQYLTSQLIVSVLCEVGRKEEGPEVIIVLPKKSGGWMEKKTMGLLQASALRKILEADRHGRAHVYFPFDADISRQNSYITVHSKLLLIDDRYVSVGSANLNNRSMGLDTECNLTLDASRHPLLRARVMDTLASLLSHFSRTPPEEVRPWLESRTPIAEILERIKVDSPGKHLASFEVPKSPEQAWLDADLLDMESPSPLETAIDRWARMSDSMNQKMGISPRSLALALTLLVALLLAAAWTFTPLSGYLDIVGLKELLHGFEAGAWTTLIALPLAFAAGGLLFFPINLLIIATASIYPASWAFAYIGLGVLANTVISYAIGRVAGQFFFNHFFGRRTRDILNRIGEGHFMAIMLVRIVPIAPASVVNLAAGSGRIPLLRFLAATFVGMAPGTIMLVVFQRSVIDLFRRPSLGAVVVVIMLSLTAFLLYRWSKGRFSNYRS